MLMKPRNSPICKEDSICIFGMLYQMKVQIIRHGFGSRYLGFWKREFQGTHQINQKCLFMQFLPRISLRYLLMIHWIGYSQNVLWSECSMAFTRLPPPNLNQILEIFIDGVRIRFSGRVHLNIQCATRSWYVNETRPC